MRASATDLPGGRSQADALGLGRSAWKKTRRPSPVPASEQQFSALGRLARGPIDWRLSAERHHVTLPMYPFSYHWPDRTLRRVFPVRKGTACIRCWERRLIAGP
jgi:hypothetical protein